MTTPKSFIFLGLFFALFILAAPLRPVAAESNPSEKDGGNHHVDSAGAFLLHDDSKGFWMAKTEIDESVDRQETTRAAPLVCFEREFLESLYEDPRMAHHFLSVPAMPDEVQYVVHRCQPTPLETPVASCPLSPILVFLVSSLTFFITLFLVTLVDYFL